MSTTQKQKALAAFSQKDYVTAINHFNNGLREDVNDSALWLGHARSLYYNGKDQDKLTPVLWKKIVDGCERALQLDENNFEAIHLRGLELLDNQDDPLSAVEILSDLLEKLAITGKKYRHCIQPGWILEDINRAKKQLKLVNQRQQVDSRVPLYGHLMGLLEKDYHAQIEAVTKKNVPKDIKQYKLHRLAATHLDYCNDLSKIFEMTGMMDLHRGGEAEVPDCFIDPISLEVFHDPVCTKLGESYERLVLFNYLENKAVDPVTREKLTPEMCYTNKRLKDLLEEWRAKNSIPKNQ